MVRNNNKIPLTIKQFPLLELATDAIIIANKKGEILLVNKQAKSVFGYRTNELVGRPLEFLFPPVSQRSNGKAFVHHFANPKLKSKTVTKLYASPKDGSRFPAEITLAPLKAEAGIFVAAFVRVMPIAEKVKNLTVGLKNGPQSRSSKKSSQKKVKKFEKWRELFAAIVRSSDDAILSKNLAGIITSWNRGAERIFGYSPKEVIGKHISVLIPSHLQHEETSIMAKIRKGEDIDLYETERITKYGKIIDVSLSISPLKNRSEKIIGASKILRDITEPKRTKDQLIEREEQLELFIEHSPAALAMFDTNMSYLAVSQRWINDYNLKEPEIIGKSHYEIFPEVPAYWKQIHQRCLHGGVEKKEQELFKRADGSKSWLRWEVRPWHKATGQIGGIIIFSEEITQRIEGEQKIKKLNAELEERVLIRTEQLRQTNKELESFSYSVSHDLRGPLRIIDGFGQILIEDYSQKLDEEGRNTINVIMTNARKMGQLIDDLLSFSKIGRSEMSVSRVDMNKLAKEAIQELRAGSVIMTDNLKLKPLRPARGDNQLLKQVWINLISNAAKYSGRKKIPAIEIGMVDSEGNLAYYVKDNGAGFNMKYAGKLFGVFQRLHKEEDFPGTGVGLALVQRIILRHGGKIWAKARENEGATFYFTLPG